MKMLKPRNRYSRVEYGMTKVIMSVLDRNSLNNVLIRQNLLTLTGHTALEVFLAPFVIYGFSLTSAYLFIFIEELIW